MQEDIENRTITLMVNSSKFTGRTMLAAINKFLAHMKNHSQLNGGITHHGKQTVKQLIGKDQGVTSIELKDQHIQDFERTARKFGVDYAIRKVKGDRSKYLIFFKGRDEDAITAAMTEYTIKRLHRDKRPSVRNTLDKLKTMLSVSGPVRKKDKELSR